jgi:hypothetical protein
MARNLKQLERASGQLKAGPTLEVPGECTDPGDAGERPMTASELFDAIQSSGLIGMWKNRTDIGDSSAYARELRRRAQERQW